MLEILHRVLVSAASTLDIGRWTLDFLVIARYCIGWGFHDYIGEVVWQLGEELDD